MINTTGVEDDTSIVDAEEVADGPYIWDDDCEATCWTCEFEGTVEDFRA
jgi:hypothetical protein